MKADCLKLLQFVLNHIFAHKFKTFRIGTSTDLFIWRIKTKLNNELTIGKNSFIRDQVVFERDNAKLTIGDRTFIGRGLIAISTSVEIGNDVMISWGVTIVDHNSHSLRFSERQNDVQSWLIGEKDWSNVKASGVVIHDKVWIGFDVAILNGVTIGEGAIIGAKSVVTKSVMPWTVVAGNPAIVIREIGLDER